MADETRRSPFVGRDSWIAKAACVGDDRFDWFPDKKTNVGSPSYKQRKQVLDRICADCVVSAECLAEALRLSSRDDVYGIRAGTSQHDRQRMRQ